MKTNSLYLLLGCVAIGNVWADESSFRLTGIIKTDKSPIALIEYPSGIHAYLHEGDTLGSGKLASITDQWIKVTFPNGQEKHYCLNGAALPVCAEYFGTGGSDAAETETMKIAPDYARVELDKILASEAKNKKDELAKNVNRIFGIPAKARIEAIDGQPFNSDKMLVKLLQASLKNGGGIMIKVSGMPSGANMIYMMAHSEPAPIQQ